MRGREGDRRAAPARGDMWGDNRDRDRPRPSNTKNGRRSRSRSPIKSKLMALAMSTGGRESNQVGDRSRRESSRDRERSQKGPGRLRMDELDGRRLTIKARSPEHEHRRSDAGYGQRNKPGSSLDKVVKKAREERTNYWDKKIIEAEEKDPDRWGHSGYKELYHKADRKKISPKKRQRSRSGSPKRGIRTGSRSVSPNFRSMSRSFSRSRSPIKRIAKSRKDLRSFSRSVSPVSARKPRMGLIDKSKDMGAKKSTASSSGAKANGPNLRKQAPTAHHVLSKSGLLIAKGNSAARSAAKSKVAAIPSNRPLRRSSSFSSSGSSVSRSPPRSKLGYQLPPAKKRNSGGRPLAKHSKVGKPTAVSDSYSSSTSSSDEDVLQLHAKDRARSSSFSQSDSRSSSSSGGRGRTGGIIRRASSSSSSETQTSSDSDSDISIRAKPKPAQRIVVKNDKVAAASKKINTIAKIVTTPAASAATATAQVMAGSSATSNKSTISKKAPGTDALKSIKSKSGTTSIGSKIATASKSKSVEKEKNVKKGSESGETESESESDSDSEPRMTLSERFAKLSQMSTDKREMAKPVLSVNEIDTKMRVVKDFRNPEIPKIFHAVDASSASVNRMKSTACNPPAFPDESRRDMPADDRQHQHFERMYRDVPAEQPLDWSDPRVRFNYYKNRGCFDERPITFDEYIKWEDWYHKYREWLEQEAYYSQQQQGGRPASSPGSRIPMKGVGGFPLGRRMDQTPMASGPPLSSRAHFGRPEDTTYLQAHERVGRRIDRTVGGSLVVNIHPYNNGNGFQTRRHIGRPQ